MLIFAPSSPVQRDHGARPHYREIALVGRRNMRDTSRSCQCHFPRRRFLTLSIFASPTATAGSPASHWMASKERGEASGNRLWALHVQQLSDAFNPAALELWEPGV